MKLIHFVTALLAVHAAACGPSSPALVDTLADPPHLDAGCARTESTCAAEPIGQTAQALTAAVTTYYASAGLPHDIGNNVDMGAAGSNLCVLSYISGNISQFPATYGWIYKQNGEYALFAAAGAGDTIVVGANCVPFAAFGPTTAKFFSVWNAGPQPNQNGFGGYSVTLDTGIGTAGWSALSGIQGNLSSPVHDLGNGTGSHFYTSFDLAMTSNTFTFANAPPPGCGAAFTLNPHGMAMTSPGCPINAPMVVQPVTDWIATAYGEPDPTTWFQWTSFTTNATRTCQAGQAGCNTLQYSECVLDEYTHDCTPPGITDTTSSICGFIGLGGQFRRLPDGVNSLYISGSTGVWVAHARGDNSGTAQAAYPTATVSCVLFGD